MMTGGHATRQILELNVDEPETQKLTDVALHEALAKGVVQRNKGFSLGCQAPAS